jgi:hypothetical protein
MRGLGGSDGGRFTRGEGDWRSFSVREVQADFYVAPNGNDAWSGRLPEPNEEGTDGPFATLKRAQEAVRVLKREVYQEKKRPAEARYIGSSHKYGRGKDILVLIRGGYYLLEEPLYFGPEDGGERCETDQPSGAFEFNLLKDYYVTYAAYPGEIPIIAGCKRIVNWQKEQDRWVTYLGDEKVERLIINGKKQKLARTPNEGYFYVAETPTTAEEFKFCKGDIEKWDNLEGNRIIFLLRWHIGINSIKEIDEEKNIIRLEKPQPGLLEVPPRYYVENIEALLDAPGEWYFDIHTGRLILIPPVDITDPNNAFIVIPTIGNLIVVKGEPNRPVRNLRFYGLYLQATTPGGSAVSFEYARNCELLESKLTGIGGTGIKIGKGCYGTRIYKNTIDGVEEGGIYVSGSAYPESWTDIIDGTVISYNKVSNAGRIAIYSANTLNTVISHNEVKDTAWAIKVGGWSNIEEAIDGGYRVEYNHIHHTMIDADDGGALTVAGQTSNAIVRGNLIHDVQPSFFNENTAFMFDNWSAGWVVEENIYYNLKQAPMKLCAATLLDNIYRDNFYIEEPVRNDPEDIIDGEPSFEYMDLKVSKKEVKTGEVVKVTCTIYNSGTTGIKKVALFVNGKITEYKKFPVVHNNERTIEFNLRLYEPGRYKVSVGGLEDLLSTPEALIEVSGDKIQIVYDNLELSERSGIIPAGEGLDVRAEVKNIGDQSFRIDIPLYLNGDTVQLQTIELSPKETRNVSFSIKPEKGIHRIWIGNTHPATVKVYPHHPVDITKLEWYTYTATRARPSSFKVDPENNYFEIIAGGTDFLHAEDSYGAIYLKRIVRGNFIATVKVVRFEKNANPWYRAGIYVRNDISKSFETQPGSLGSVLVFITPKVAGVHWDEFGDGCMHQAGTSTKLRYEPNETSPIWLRLVRHGDSFTGYISYDEQEWIKLRDTKPVPGLAKEMDIGLAAGTIDRRPSLVVFKDFSLELEEEGWEERV